jgi:hypothetical protein
LKIKLNASQLIFRCIGNNAVVAPLWSELMTDNANKPGDQRIDGVQHQADKASEKFSKDTPEVNAGNLRAARKLNPNRINTVSPDGQSRFGITDNEKPNEKQARAAQEKAYSDAGLGDPNKPIGKSSEPGIDPQKALNTFVKFSKSAASEGAKLWQGTHNGMHEFVDETAKSLIVAKDYYGNALAGKVNLDADIKEFAAAISNGVSQSFGAAGDYYFRQVPKGEADLGKDIGTVSKAASDHWNSLDTEQKGHFIGKEVVPLLVPGALSVAAKEIQGANLVGKAGEAITSFASTEKFGELDQKMAQLQGHIQKMQELAKPLQPAFAAATDGPGRRIEIPKKGDSVVFSMSEDSGQGEELPRKTGRLEKESVPEKITPPSEKIVTELKQVVERLPQSEREFLKAHDIEVKPVHRITDIPDTNKRMAGCFKPNEKTIYVPEEVFQNGHWVENTDIEFVIRHEYGHALNVKARPFGEPISDTREFIDAFNKDFKHMPDSMKDTLQLSEKFKSINGARDEVFADLWAHSTGHNSNHAYSQLMKKQFPNVLKFFMERK